MERKRHTSEWVSKDVPSKDPQRVKKSSARISIRSSEGAPSRISGSDLKSDRVRGADSVIQARKRRSK